MENILRTYQGKTKETVVAQGSGFRRDVLADTVFALNAISEELYDMVNTLQTSNMMEALAGLGKEITLLKECIPSIIKDTIESSLTKKF